MRPQISIEPFENQEARLIAGVDVGVAGSIFFLDLDREPAYGTAIDIPVHLIERGGKTKREVDVAGLVLLLSRPLVHVYVEAVTTMPKQGVVSTFNFGRAFGTVLGVLGALEIPTTLVAPVRWKLNLGVPAGKSGARARASQLLPYCAFQWRLATQHNRAEAACIAIWGARQLLMTSPDLQPSGKRSGVRSPTD